MGPEMKKQVSSLIFYDHCTNVEVKAQRALWNNCDASDIWRITFVLFLKHVLEKQEIKKSRSRKPDHFHAVVCIPHLSDFRRVKYEMTAILLNTEHCRIWRFHLEHTCGKKTILRPCVWLWKSFFYVFFFLQMLMSPWLHVCPSA